MLIASINIRIYLKNNPRDQNLLGRLLQFSLLIKHMLTCKNNQM